VFVWEFYAQWKIPASRFLPLCLLGAVPHIYRALAECFALTFSGLGDAVRSASTASLGPKKLILLSAVYPPSPTCHVIVKSQSGASNANDALQHDAAELPRKCRECAELEIQLVGGYARLNSGIYFERNVPFDGKTC
jgi:hypothetical protein